MGDRLIADAAQVLKQTFRESDVIARLGRDKFAVFVPDCGAEDDIVTRLQEGLTSFNQAEKRPYQLSMSMGLSICQMDVTTSLETPSLELIDHSGRPIDVSRQNSQAHMSAENNYRTAGK